MSNTLCKLQTIYQSSFHANTVRRRVTINAAPKALFTMHKILLYTHHQGREKPKTPLPKKKERRNGAPMEPYQASPVAPVWNDSKLLQNVWEDVSLSLSEGMERPLRR